MSKTAITFRINKTNENSFTLYLFGRLLIDIIGPNKFMISIVDNTPIEYYIGGPVS